MDAAQPISEHDRSRFKELAAQILDPDRQVADLVEQVDALRTLLEQHMRFDFTPLVNLGEGQTRTASGVAVSPLQAALCARQVLRSAAFIRGAAAAVAAAAVEREPVRVLYAGCGPFALLALPLMALLSPRQAVFTLIDIHPDALACARDLVERFGFAGHVLDYVCADATRYRVEPSAPPHVIVSETMSVCLGNEPQVSIARHLLAQAPDALMVPAAVRVEACLLDPGRERLPIGLVDAELRAEPLRDRIYLGTVFELNARQIARWADIDGDTLPAARIALPAAFAPRYQLRLLTRIEVFGAIGLSDYDSSLNEPQRLPGRPVFSGGEQLQFHYRLGSHPGLGYQ